MTKLNPEHQPLTIPMGSQLNPWTHSEPASRLIVLVPNPEADLTAVTQRVWELASATGARIKFVGLCSDAIQEPSLRRTLVTQSAIANNSNVSTDVEVLFGRDWVKAVKSFWQPGDTIVCFDEQRVGLLQKPLHQILRSDLDIPMYILSSPYPQNDLRSSWITRSVAWLGFIVIIIVFFMLQVKIDHFAKSWTIGLQVLSTAIEFWLIWIWNNLFR